MQFKRMQAVWTGPVQGALAVVLLFSAAHAQALIVNGDFSQGLNYWETGGGVSVDGGVAQLDDSDFFSYLYQPVAIGSGHYQFSFDYQLHLSPVTDTGDLLGAFDLFAVSLYFVNDASEFSLFGGPYSSIPLFDLQYSGNSAWQSASFSFSNPDAYAFVIPVFEVFDLNNIAGDSHVLLRDVEMSIIPVPPAAGLILLGMAGIGLRRRLYKD